MDHYFNPLLLKSRRRLDLIVLPQTPKGTRKVSVVIEPLWVHNDCYGGHFLGKLMASH